MIYLIAFAHVSLFYKKEVASRFFGLMKFVYEKDYLSIGTTIELKNVIKMKSSQIEMETPMNIP